MCPSKLAGAVASPFLAITGLGKKLLPKPPKMEPVIDRQAEKLPDGGDPYAYFRNRMGRKLMQSTSIFAGRAPVTPPTVTGGMGG